MTDTQEAGGAAADLVAAWRPFLDFWAAQTKAGAEQAQADGLTGESPPAEALHRWLEAQAGVVDAFLRTPVFLEAMRRHLEALTLLKSGMGPAPGLAGLPVSQDVIARLERLEAGQSALLARLADLEQRLAAPSSQGPG